MAARKGPRKLYRYSAEFKLKAVKLSQIDGVRVQDVADALGIHPFMLSKWRRDARAGRIRAQVKARYALLKEEHELLEKAIRFCSARRAPSSRSSRRSGTVTG